MQNLSYFNIRNALLLLLMLSVCYLVACGNSKPTSFKPSKVSTATGKRFNQPDGFQVRHFAGQYKDPNIVYVAGGSVLLGGFGENTPQNSKREITVTSFFLKETEVTNIEWNEYLFDLKKNVPDQYEAALPNDKVWERDLAYNDSYILNYRTHGSFRYYPVVGVSWQQASEYCQWLTEQVNNEIAKKTGKPSVMANPQEGDVDDQSIETDAFVAGYRLPTEAEWDYAAMAMVGTQDLNLVQSTQRVYPWGDGLSLRGKEGKWKGKYLANFKRSPGNYKGLPGESSSGSPTTYVYEYPANDLGLYDMGGNVSEWVNDIYRPLSYQVFEDFNPVRRDETLDPEKDYDPSNSLVNNRARVYKGASWKDCAYWSQIGTRRYLDQDASTATIGFRYAMTSMGEMNN